MRKLIILFSFVFFSCGHETNKVDSEQLKIRRTQGTDEYDNVNCSLLDKTGNIWFGTSGGVCSYDGKSFTRFSIPSDSIYYSHPPNFPNDNPFSKSVCSALQDKEGNLWLGTDYIGVYRYDGKLFTNFLSNDSILSFGKRNFQSVACMFEMANQLPILQ